MSLCQARFPFKRNRLRCVRCVNEKRKKRKRLRFLRFAFTQRKRLRLNGNRASEFVDVDSEHVLQQNTSSNSFKKRVTSRPDNSQLYTYLNE